MTERVTEEDIVKLRELAIYLNLEAESFDRYRHDSLISEYKTWVDILWKTIKRLKTTIEIE